VVFYLREEAEQWTGASGEERRREERRPQQHLSGQVLHCCILVARKSLTVYPRQPPLSHSMAATVNPKAGAKAQ
jgi:hypothetical protein